MIKLQPTLKGYVEIAAFNSNKKAGQTYAKEHLKNFIEYAVSNPANCANQIVQLIEENPMEDITGAIALFMNIEIRFNKKDEIEGKLILDEKGPKNSKIEIEISKDTKIDDKLLKKLFPTILYNIRAAGTFKDFGRSFGPDVLNICDYRIF